MLINVYAIYTTIKRCFHWLELLDGLPRGIHWMLIDSWIFVQKRSDKTNVNGTMILESERQNFISLIMALEIEDLFSTINPIRFS